MTADDGTVSRELARRDLEDISSLRANEPFNRYWIRRVRQKCEVVTGKFKYDPPEKCTPVQREELRQQMVLLEDLLKMMDTDEKSARGMMR